mgnify:CR=1 FL=1
MPDTREMKKCSDSITEITKLLQYRDINGQNRLFGGRLMEWIDEAAGVAAMRHAGGNCVTLMVDSLKFKKGAFLNDIVVLIAKVTYVGNTSMEVRVDTYAEEKASGVRTAINHAYLTLVHVDDNGVPQPIKYGLKPETINEQIEWEGAVKRKEIRKHEVQAPSYDPDEEPIMNNERIRQLLPHRYPMQLVDKVIAIGPSTIVGVKNVTANEPFFQGHFPNEPVMPGVLQIEAMAQCGGLLILGQLEDPEKWSTYFLKINDVKFRKKVVPGDTLIFKVELLSPVRHGISSMKGYMFVGDQIVSEATFTAQIIKNKE